ncbi:MAG: phage major capsid protein [Clostridia bacterium]|jgi:HK97 family phage major capsid protein
MSKKLKDLLAELDVKNTLAKTLLDKADATADEISAVSNDIKAIKAKIEVQKTLDEGKKFDDEGCEILDKTPVIQPVYADPNTHKKLWVNNGEFLKAVFDASKPNPTIDPRLTIKNNATGMNEQIPSDGGFLVGEDFTKELLKKTYETGILPTRCRTIPISAGSNALSANGIDETSRANGSRWGGIESFWENEADAMTGKKPKFSKVELKLKKLTGLCYMTDELLQDAVAMESIIGQAFAEEFGFKMDDAILNGIGAGQPLGVLNSTSLVTVAKENAQVATTIVLQNIIKMWARLWGRSKQNAVWLINQDIEPQLYALNLSIGNNAYPVYMPAGGVSGAPYATLFGRPVIEIEQCSTLGALGDIILGDFSQYLLIDKGGINQASSVHVRFLYDESVFRFIYRVDGQPIWKTALTPYKGSNTLSPFVTLAERK